MNNVRINDPYINSFYYMMLEYKVPQYMNYAYIMAVSGSANRLSWRHGFLGKADESNDSELFITGDRLIQLRNIWKRCGFVCNTYLLIEENSFWKENYSKPVRWVNQKDGREKVLELLKEKPVLILGQGFSYVAVGYSNDILYGHVSRYNEMDSDSIREIPDWDKEMKGFCEIISFEAIEANKEILYKTLVTTMNYMKVSKRKWFNHISFGVDSINQVVDQLVWDESFQFLKIDEKYDGKISWPKKKHTDYYIENGARTVEDIYQYNLIPYVRRLANKSYFIDFLSSIVKKEEFVFFKKDIESIILIYEEVIVLVNKLKQIIQWNELIDNDNMKEIQSESINYNISKEVRYEMAAILINIRIQIQYTFGYMDKIIQGIDNIWQQKNVL